MIVKTLRQAALGASNWAQMNDMQTPANINLRASSGWWLEH